MIVPCAELFIDYIHRNKLLSLCSSKPHGMVQNQADSADREVLTVAISDLEGENSITAIPNSALDATLRPRRCLSQPVFSHTSFHRLFAG